MPQYYPIFMNLEAQTVLVVGGGQVALRKVQVLLAHGARVCVVSPQLIPELEAYIDDKDCRWLKKSYSAEDMEDAVLVFSCTEKEKVNAEVAQDAKRRRRPVNVVDDPEKCSFIVPSIMEQGDLKIAVSTSGSSPLVAGQIRRELESLYGEETAAYLALLKTWRSRVKSGLPPEKRNVFWQRVTDGQVRELVKAQEFSEAEGVIEKCFQSLLD